jgi:hypothetical protein
VTRRTSLEVSITSEDPAVVGALSLFLGEVIVEAKNAWAARYPGAKFETELTAVVVYENGTVSSFNAEGLPQ